MVKIIFSDFDETLIDYYGKNNDIFDYKVEILDRVKVKGIKFVIVTGRPIIFFKKFPKLLEFIDYIISSNGAEIYDVKEDKIIYSSSIDNVVCNDILKYCNDNGIGYFINSGFFRYTEKDNIRDYNDLNQIILIPKNNKDFEELKYFLVGIKEIKLSNIVYNDVRCSIDINNKDVSKGNAILYLCKFLSIDIKDTIGFGDSNNDLSMFEVVGKSICVGNATDVIKQLVDDVADSCDEDGVFKYLENNILN